MNVFDLEHIIAKWAFVVLAVLVAVPVLIYWGWL
jgi:hypothetical protein